MGCGYCQCLAVIECSFCLCFPHGPMLCSLKGLQLSACCTSLEVPWV